MKHVHRERREKARRTSSNGHHSSGMLIKEQSQSVLRGEHPIAFVLPTVRYLLIMKTKITAFLKNLDVAVYQHFPFLKSGFVVANGNRKRIL